MRFHDGTCGRATLLMSLLLLAHLAWGAALTGVTLAVTPPAPQPSGATVTLTATAVGGAAVQYCYWLGTTVNGATTWKVVRAFAVDPVFRWTPGAGNYIIEVIAREGTATTGLVSKSLAYTITGTPALAAVTLATTPAGPQPAGATITCTATAVGGSAALYSFWLGATVNGTTTWTLARDFAADPVFRWTPGAGSYIIEVIARDDAVMVNKAIAYTVTGTPALSGVRLAADPPSPQIQSTPITLTATPTGGADLHYRFWHGTVTAAGTTWVMLRDYAADPAYRWTPSAAGNYVFEVAARDAATPDATPRIASLAFTVTGVTDPLGDVALSLSSATREVHSPIVLTAKPYGGSAVQMQFVAGTLTGRAWTWTVLQDFSPATTCTWTPTAAGAYRLLVWARDGATAVKELYDTQTVVIRHPGETPSTKVTVAPFKGNRAAAVSYTFDDGTKNQYVYGVPIFDQHGLRATFNVVGHYTPDSAGNYDSVSWAEWRTALARGHEVGNHSLDHLNMNTLTAAQATVQVEENARLIAEKLGVTPVSFALPHTAGNSRVYEIIHRTHVALRGDYVNYGGADFTAAQANAMVNSAVANRRWLVPILHGVADTTYLPISREALSTHLAYAKGCDAWIDTFGVISRYVLERDTAQLAVAEDAPGRCTFTLGTPLDLAIYNVPLTVCIGPLAAQPANVQAYRSGDATLLPATVTDTAGAWSIQLDVTPGPIPVTVLWDTAP